MATRPGTSLGAVAAALVLGCAGMSGCAVTRAVHSVAGSITGNKHTIDSFTGDLKSGGPSTFQATYSTSGASTATVVYAARPPNQVAFTETQPGASGPTLDIVSNSTGTYLCNRSTSSAPWACEKGSTTSSQEQALVDLYTPAHWVTFLNDFSLAAGFAGDKVSSSTMSVNGFDLKCVDLVAPGVQGTSTICSTSQGLLGYVKVASTPTSFEITNFTTSPPASLFTVPAGASITTITVPSSTSQP